MKRSRGSTDSLASFLPICHSASDNKPNTSFLYSGAGDYTPMFDGLEDDGSLEDIGVGSTTGGGAAAEKKRRLSVEQVKALEKNFEIDNKLEPERKVKLAQELALQPRQVAIWFQNRRARWKTKQLERDYGVLKSNFDALKRNRDALQRDNDSLLGQIKELKAKLNMEMTGGSNSIQENDVVTPAETVGNETMVMPDNELLELNHCPPPPPPPSHIQTDAPASELAYEMFNIFPCNETFREDPADSSDSSAVLNEEYSPTTAVAAATATIECFGQYVKMEEHEDLFSGEEACKLFADNEQWYCSSEWNS